LVKSLDTPPVKLRRVPSIGRDPAHPPRLVHVEGEVHPIGMLQDRGALDTAEPAERVPEDAESAGRGLFVGHHEVSLEVPALGPKRAQPPIEPALPVEVQGTGTDVFQQAAEPAALK
jgi:hypothetical protein